MSNSARNSKKNLAGEPWKSHYESCWQDLKTTVSASRLKRLSDNFDHPGLNYWNKNW